MRGMSLKFGGIKRSYKPRELRIRMYRDVLRLREQGLGCKRIWRRIEEVYGERLSMATISAGLGGSTPH